MTTHIYRRDKTKKMALEVIFQKSCFRPKNRPKKSKKGRKTLIYKFWYWRPI